MVIALKDPAGGAGAKPLLDSANTVHRVPTGGARGKPLLGSANTIWCLFGVRLG